MQPHEVPSRHLLRHAASESLAIYIYKEAHYVFPSRDPVKISYITILTFSLSPLTISSSMAISCGISHVQLTYRPASHFRFSFVRYTMVLAESSGVSTKTFH